MLLSTKPMWQAKEYKMVAEAKPSEAMHRAQSNRGHPQANLLMTMSKLSILLATSGSPIPTDVQNGVSRISVGLPRGSLVCSAEPSASCSSSAFLVGLLLNEVVVVCKLAEAWVLDRRDWAASCQRCGQQLLQSQGLQRGKLASSKGANMASATL